MEAGTSGSARTTRFMMEGVGARVIRGPEWKWGKQVRFMYDIPRPNNLYSKYYLCISLLPPTSLLYKKQCLHQIEKGYYDIIK